MRHSYARDAGLGGGLAVPGAKRSFAKALTSAKGTKRRARRRSFGLRMSQFVSEICENGRRCARSSGMSVYPRLCCKTRKTNDAQNLAKVDFCRSPSLRRSVAPIRTSAAVFAQNDMGPSRLRVRNASAVLENFLRQVKKIFAAQSLDSRHRDRRVGMSQTCQTRKLPFKVGRRNSHC